MDRIIETILDSGILHVCIDQRIRHRDYSSPVYCDCRELWSMVAQRSTIAAALVDQIHQEYNSTRQLVIAGISVAGIPWAAFVAERLELPLLVVRSKAKDYGKCKMVEGRIPADACALLVDDTLFSGAALMDAYEALRAVDVRVIGVQVILSYRTSDVLSFRDSYCVGLRALCQVLDLLASAQAQHQISDAEARECRLFIDSITDAAIVH